MTKFSDECGIVGVVTLENHNAASMAYYGLNGIQHRGQESAGLAVMANDQISCFKQSGLVTDVFTDQILELLNSQIALGHVNQYADKLNNTHMQPFVVNDGKTQMALAYNGGLTNRVQLRQELSEKGAIFTSNSDAETIAICIAQNNHGDIVEAIQKTMLKLRGGYAFAVLCDDVIYAVRDPLGIRPLALGTIENGYLLASESCALELMGGELERDVEPGEIVALSKQGTMSYVSLDDNISFKKEGCLFEYIYFARPDSTIDGVNVFQSRELAGAILAQEAPVQADLVVGVPDSGTPAATGFAMSSGIPYSACMIKNKYIGRTYIVGDKQERENSVRIKLNPVRELIVGKKIVLVDDSIVRGTTMRAIISNIREIGAKEVHLRISSPPVLHTCYYGVETPEEKDMVANNMSTDELAKLLGADSLHYISIEGLLKSVEYEKNHYCAACFNGCYPGKIQ